MADGEERDQGETGTTTTGPVRSFGLGRIASLTLVVLGILLLVIGILLFASAEAADVQLRMTIWLFGFLWIGTCLWMVAYGFRGLMARR